MHNEKAQDLRVRTKEFALRIIRLYVSLPKSTEAQVLGKQVLRSGTSVGAHCREGQRATSRLESLRKEADELTAIFVTIVTKVKGRLNNAKQKTKTDKA